MLYLKTYPLTQLIWDQIREKSIRDSPDFVPLGSAYFLLFFGLFSANIPSQQQVMTASNALQKGHLASLCAFPTAHHCPSHVVEEREVQQLTIFSRSRRHSPKLHLKSKKIAWRSIIENLVLVFAKRLICCAQIWNTRFKSIRAVIQLKPFFSTSNRCESVIRFHRFTG